jgi:hypothetical protein
LRFAISTKLTHVVATLCVLASAGAGCDSKKPPPVMMCPDPVPAFRVRLTSGSTLPPGAKLEVVFGGAQSEQYVLGEAHSSNETVCCTSLAAGAPVPSSIPCDGAAGTPQVADASQVLDAGATAVTEYALITCELWTNGAAKVTVEAEGYQVSTETLVAEADEELEYCNAFRTVYVDLSLLRPDAGE